jgi:hypothetical protein
VCGGNQVLGRENGDWKSFFGRFWQIDDFVNACAYQVYQEVLLTLISKLIINVVFFFALHVIKR